MPTFTLKNIPPDLYDRLKASAEDHRRSINSEMLVCLEQALGVRPADPEELLARARAARRRVGEEPLTAAEVTAAKREGRA
jgi:plasmid stability protein